MQKKTWILCYITTFQRYAVQRLQDSRAEGLISVTAVIYDPAWFYLICFQRALQLAEISERPLIILLEREELQGVSHKSPFTSPSSV